MPAVCAVESRGGVIREELSAFYAPCDAGHGTHMLPQPGNESEPPKHESKKYWLRGRIEFLADDHPLTDTVLVFPARFNALLYKLLGRDLGWG